MNQDINRKKALLIISLCVFALILARASADVLPVPSDRYPTITVALEFAFSGDQILVAAGRYEENITITSGVELIGAGQDKTTIVGIENETVITVSTPGPGPTVSDLTISGGRHGFDFSSSSGTLHNVTIRGTSHDGITCSGDSFLIISNTIITGSERHGIFIRVLFSKPGIKIRTSIITQNEGDGVWVESGNPDLGTAADPGHNEISRNRGFNVNNRTNNEIKAIGNWWRLNPPR